MTKHGQKIWKLQIEKEKPVLIQAIKIDGVAYNGMNFFNRHTNQKELTFTIELVKELKKVKCENPLCKKKVYDEDHTFNGMYKGYCHTCYWKLKGLDDDL